MIYTELSGGLTGDFIFRLEIVVFMSNGKMVKFSKLLVEVPFFVVIRMGPILKSMPMV